MEKKWLQLQQMWLSSLINRSKINLFTLILVLFSLALSNEEKTEIIEVKLNVSPGRIDGREWIPFHGGTEISNKEFWKLLGNEENVNYWEFKEKTIKNVYIHQYNRHYYIFFLPKIFLCELMKLQIKT